MNAFFVSNPWRARTRDARGEWLPLYKLSGYWFRRWQPGALPPAVFARVRRKLIDAGYRNNLGAGPIRSFIIAAVLGGFLVFLWHLSGGRMPRQFLFVFGFSCLLHIFLGLTFRHRVPKAPDWKLVQVLLEERLCPCCAFSLAGSPASDTGSTVCPECGGHWNLPAGPSAKTVSI